MAKSTRQVRDLNFKAVPFAEDAGNHRRRFILMPSRWHRFATKAAFPGLTWTNDLAFDKASAASVPARSGVYAFKINPRVPAGLNHAYVVYVGETENLNRRFREYLRREMDSGRVRLYDLFSKYVHATYGNSITFSYAEVPVGRIKRTEIMLIATLWPPVNQKLPGRLARAQEVLNAR